MTELEKEALQAIKDCAARDDIEQAILITWHTGIEGVGTVSIKVAAHDDKTAWAALQLQRMVR